jgi:DNA-binding IclR family transcriptional regulator
MESGKTQVVTRVTAILNAIALHGATGARLLDLAEETGISRPTVHRILHELAEAGFVERRPSRRYGLGAALYLLGLSAPSPIDDHAGLQQVARRLADQSGDSVYVAVRRADGVHYLVRADGSYPIRAELVEVGQTVPLGATFAGIALLAWHEPEAVEAQLLANERLWRSLQAAQTPDLKDTLAAVRREIAQVHERGYCFDKDTVMRGVSGMAAPVHSKTTAEPYMAITISAVNDRLPPERVEELAPLLLAAAQESSAFIR